MLVLGIFSLMTAVALPNVNISPILLTRVASIVLLYAAALSYNALDIQAIGSGVSIYSGLFQVTSVSQATDTFIFLVGAMILLPWAPVSYSFSNLATAVPTIREYPLIILFTTCGATFLVSSADLVSLYLSIELQSFAVYILATLYRDSESATSAGLKYFLLGGLSSGLILLGSALVYAYTGLTNLESIFSILSCVDSLENNSISVDNLTSGLGPCIIGLTILTVGFLFKVSAAPFHNWSPDVYDGVPTIVTTWLAIMPKISIFVFLLELQTGLGFTGASLSLLVFADGVSFDVWKNLLLVSSLLSLIIGTVVGLAQYRIKRLLAYSTISHVGFLLLALAVNSEESIESFLFYIVQYSITNLNAFLVVLAFGYVMHRGAAVTRKKSSGLRNSFFFSSASSNSTDIQFISEMRGQFRANPLLGLALTVSLFSMAGVPPLVGFFGKQMVLYSAVHRGYYFLSFVAIIVSVISASYYLKIVRVIHFDNIENNRSEPTQDTVRLKVSNFHSFAIASLTMGIALFVFKPSIILNSTNLLALTLFHN
jgi:NADH-ubiquinone oxidoreductase chain 2